MPFTWPIRPPREQALRGQEWRGESWEHVLAVRVGVMSTEERGCAGDLPNHVTLEQDSSHRLLENAIDLANLR